MRTWGAMRRLPVLFLVLVLATPALAGCIGGDDPATPAATSGSNPHPATSQPGDEPGNQPTYEPPSEPEPSSNDDRTGSSKGSGGGPDYPECTHPYPCPGADWPRNLTGPFALGEVREVSVTSWDGTTLHGWLLLPDLPEGVTAPTVLVSSPAWGESRDRPDDAQGRRSFAATYPFDRLVREGFAVAAFNVRGTGNSGGCFDLWGHDEQRDQSHLVSWLAERPWSNGRVGMMGLSYDAATAMSAAVQAPHALKTVVMAGLVTDAYQYFHTPQGLLTPGAPAGATVLTAWTSLKPPIVGAADDPEHATVDHAPVAPERACRDVAEANLEAWTGTPTGSRDPAFYEPRSFTPHLGNVTASVLLAHGFQDRFNPHGFQEDVVEQGLTAPTWMLEGPWGHRFPSADASHPRWGNATWHDALASWFGFWLKGLGPLPDGVDQVDYQVEDGAWHRSTTWPPAEEHGEVLHLTRDGLTPYRAQAGVSLRPLPATDPRWDDPRHLLCQPRAPEPPQGDVPAGPSVLLPTQPLGTNVTLAGNPMAYLEVESDQPRGLLHVTLYDLAPGFHCNAQGEPVGAEPLAEGGADLRYHEGNLRARDFPTGTPTGVRVDLTSLAARVEDGHRLALLVSSADPAQRTGNGYGSTLTLHAGFDARASHVVLPVLQGTVEGRPPMLDYPPRPGSP